MTKRTKSKRERESGCVGGGPIPISFAITLSLVSSFESVSKGSGGTVVIRSEQRGVTWGVYGVLLGPGSVLRRRKCAVYIRPRTNDNQHPVHSWTHPEHRESQNENPGTSRLSEKQSFEIRESIDRI